MRIVHLASEFAPIAKAGGLGEVTLGLSRELTSLKEEVEMIIPKYDFIDIRKLAGVKMEVPDFKCTEKGNQQANAMWSATCEGVCLKLLEVRHPSGYFHRGTIYGCEDDAARFLYFSRAALEYLKLRGKPIDILHLHDWHVAIAAVLARDLFRLPIRSIVLTIHNAEYQGRCATWDLDAIGLKGIDYLKKEKLQDDDPAHPKAINLLKGGVVYANSVTAVSPTYAKEILTPEMGYHLDPTFRKFKGKIFGILNGLDLTLWNPGYNEKDPIETIFQKKEAIRKELASRFSLLNNHRPWVGAVTRLATQKGPELLEEAIRQTILQKGVFLLLGSCPTPKIQAHFNALKEKYGSSGQLLLNFTYDEELARKIYIALDFLAIPSLYEPCGLTQMIAMRHGTIPIARATGGLSDTIFDCDNLKIDPKMHNGFLFYPFTTAAMTEGLQRAIKKFRERPAEIQRIIENGMRIDWSWKRPAQAYLSLYRKITQSVPTPS